MSADKLRRQIFKLEAELEALKVLGVFHLVPKREERSDGKGEWLAFRRRGAIIVDESVEYTYRVSLPLERNKAKANRLLRKLERTKQAEALIQKINTLKKRLQEEEKKAVEFAELTAKANEYAAKASEYAAKADALRKHALYYAERAAALQPA